MDSSQAASELRTRELSNYSYTFVRDSALAALGIAALALLAWSVIVRDGDFPRRRPLWFALEMLVMGIVGTAPFLFLAYTRQATGFESLLDFALLFLKISLLHALLQFSGVYSHLLPDALA